jgi:hypothetical protein
LGSAPPGGGRATRKTNYFHIHPKWLFFIITIGKTALFEPLPSLQDYDGFDPVFTSLDFVTVIFYRAKSSALRPTPYPGGPGLCIYVPQ